MRNRLLLWWYKRSHSESNLCESVHGRFYVVYGDGERSVLMYYKNAKTYARLFGGEVKIKIGEQIITVK